MSSCPPAEVFKIRRHRKKTECLDFPLRDKKGNLQVDKHGIDSVINEHFVQVFRQNDVQNDALWLKYWQCIDEIYQLLLEVNSGVLSESSKPDREEIFRLIRSMDAGKSVNGDMSIDLVKLNFMREQ